MKLIRHGKPGEEKPGLIDSSLTLRDASRVVPDYTPEFFADGGLDALRRLDATSLPELPAAGETRLGSPIARPGKIVCVGLNYSDHAAEMGSELPTEPVLFAKAISALSGPYDAVELPPGSTHTDWEVELALVIGKPAKRLASVEAAAEVIAGYVIANDISERDWQKNRGGQWTKGKSADTFMPLGPWLVTTDEVPNPQTLALELDVNGEPKQRGNTSTMIFSAWECVRSISQYMSLQPGDVVSTGTPPGVGMGRKPPEYLKPGDEIRLSITGLGEQRLPVIAAPTD